MHTDIDYWCNFFLLWIFSVTAEYIILWHFVLLPIWLQNHPISVYMCLNNESVYWMNGMPWSKFRFIMCIHSYSYQITRQKYTKALMCNYWSCATSAISIQLLNDNTAVCMWLWKSISLYMYIEQICVNSFISCINTGVKWWRYKTEISIESNT